MRNTFLLLYFRFSWNSAILLVIKFEYTYVFLLIYLQFLKSWVTPTILISSCFKMLTLGILKLRNTYVLAPGWRIYSFQPFIGFCFECLWWGKYSFCFIRNCCYFSLWETMTFYWIMWGPHNGNPIEITLLK